MSNLMHIVGAVIIEKEGKILLVQETMDFVKGKWNFPAGKIDPNESIIDCAIREGREETGLKLEPEYITGIYQYDGTWKNQPVTVMQVVVKATVIDGDLKTSEEISQIEWFTPEEIFEMGKRDELRSNQMVKKVEDYINGQKLGLDVVTHL